MDGGAWWAAIHGVAKSRVRLSDFTFTFHFDALEKEMKVSQFTGILEIVSPGIIDSLTCSLISGGREWRRQWHPTPVLLPGKSHGRRSLVGCSPWVREKLDTTERLPFHFSLSCIGEGNGNPLQCSCLENPMDRGAWWAAVYGVTQSRTRLK